MSKKLKVEQLLLRGQSPSKCHVDKLICLIVLVITLCVSTMLFVQGTHATEYQEDSDDFLASPIKEENKLEMTIFYEGNPIGLLDGYTSSYSETVVSLKQLLDSIRTKYRYDKTQKRISWTDNSGKWFMVKTISKTLAIGTKEIKYNPQQVYATEDDIYIGLSFLSDYTELSLSVDVSSLEASLKSKTPIFKSVQTSTATPEEKITVVEESTLVGPKPTETKKADGSAPKQPEEKKEVAETNIKLFPESKFEVNEDNFLALEINLGALTHDELVEVYQHKEFFFVPIGMLAEALDIQISANDDGSKASGWYFREENTIEVDAINKKAIISGQEESLNDAAFFQYDDDIYISLLILNKWIPLRTSVNFKKQALVLDPEFPLPFQAQREREKKREAWAAKKEKQKKKFEQLEHEYGYSSWPMGDFSINNVYSQDSNKERELKPTFSAILAGDAKLLNLNVFATGDEDELSTLRVKGSRKDINGNLPGGITDIEVGDVTGLSPSLIGGGASGRGVKLSSFPLDRASQFDSTRIEGDSLPDWEIELYSNNVLIEFQEVGADGRYVFEEVPIYYGNNDIKLVFYGPNGEVREESRKFLVNNSLVKQGDFFYSLSGVERDRQLFKVGVTDETEGRADFSSKIEYGLTDNLTLTSTTVHMQLDSEAEHTYQGIGLSTSFGEIIANANVVQDFSEGGWAAEFLANTKIGDVNVQAKQEIYSHDFVSRTNENDSGASKEQSVSTLTLTGNVEVPVISNLGYRVRAEHQSFLERKHQTSIDTRLSGTYNGISVSNNLDVNISKTPSGGTNRTMNGDLSIRGTSHNTRIRGNLTYDVEPLTQFKQASLSAQRKLTDQLDTVITVEKSLIGARDLSLSGLLNWKTDKYRLSNEIRSNTNTSLSLTTNLSFSLYQEPRSSEWEMTSKSVTGNGALSTVAFLDENYNNIFDEGEEILQEVTFLRNNVRKKSNENGISFIDNIGTNRSTNISIDTDSLDSEMLVPSVEGYAVIGHAGVFQQLNFPVVETSEIDGTVYFIDKNDVEQTVSGLTLYLLKPDGTKVGKAKTEFDGLYIFTKVVPGEYLVVVAENELKKLGVRPEENSVVAVDKSGDIFSGYDIILRDAPPEPSHAALFAPEPGKEPTKLAHTPLPKEVTQEALEPQETPAPELATVEEKEQAAEIASIERAAPVWTKKFGLPKSRYSYYLLGIFPHQKRQSIQELEERFAARNELYNSSSGMDITGSGIYQQTFWDRGNMLDNEGVAEYLASRKEIVSIMNNSAPLDDYVEDNGIKRTSQYDDAPVSGVIRTSYKLEADVESRYQGIASQSIGRTSIINERPYIQESTKRHTELPYEQPPENIERVFATVEDNFNNLDDFMEGREDFINNITDSPLYFDYPE